MRSNSKMEGTSPNFGEHDEYAIIFFGGLRKKSYEVSKLEGGLCQKGLYHNIYFLNAL